MFPHFNSGVRVMHISELETPVAIIDLDRLEANINRFQHYLDEHGIANRPHIKTHKIPAIAHMQMNAGAVGVCCQKLGEAEVMVKAGITDILIPYNIIGAQKLERLMALAKVATMSVSADSEYTVKGLSEAAHRAGVELPVLVEFDTGGKRCGVQNPQQAVDLAQFIARHPSLAFGGLMTYPLNAETDGIIEQTKALLNGLPLPCVSVGSTGQMWHAHEHKSITEYRAGMYIYGDRWTNNVGAIATENLALKVIATVVSRPTVDRGILDAGSKTLSSDLMGLTGHGMILEYPDAVIQALSEEHGHTDFSACATKPEIGERVTIIPNHCCVVSNLFNQMVGVRGDTVEVVWDVEARGLLT
jgi:D-serine deaminase-like pyridoxal phosphate-dependent protein